MVCHINDTFTSITPSGNAHMLTHIKSFIREDTGATMIEYGLLAALVALAAIIALTALGTDLNSLFTSASTKLKGASGGEAPPAGE